MLDFEDRRRPAPEINVSALMDIAFILVIFIVLAASFERVHGVDIELPSADGAPTTTDRALVVAIPAHGDLRFGDLVVATDQARGRFAAARPDHATVLLVADRTTNIERVLGVLSDARAAGFTSVAIATSPTENGSG